MVWGVSLDDHEIGVQTIHSVPLVPIVVEQLATSNPLTPTSISFHGRPQAYDRFNVQLLYNFSPRLAFGKPNDTKEHAGNGEDGATNGERLYHLTAFLAA